MVGLTAILVATDGCRSRHGDDVDDQAQVCSTGLATMSLRNRKVSQQEHERSKSVKNLTRLPERVPYGVLAL